MGGGGWTRQCHWKRGGGLAFRDGTGRGGPERPLTQLPADQFWLSPSRGASASPMILSRREGKMERLGHLNFSVSQGA